jgi:hypothetical protein
MRSIERSGCALRASSSSAQPLQSSSGMLSILVSLWERAHPRTVALLIGAVGIILMAVGFATHAQPYAATLGYDSAMTVGVLAFAFALAHGLSYRKTLEILTPLVLVQTVGAIRQGISPAPIGTELVIFSVVGFAFIALHHRAIARAARNMT